MTNQELEKYRIQLFRDAAGMEKKPDRTPLVSFFVTWKILDSPSHERLQQDGAGRPAPSGGLRL